MGTRNPTPRWMMLLVSCAVGFSSLLCAQEPSVYVVLFTHIEDNTPAGTIGTPESRTSYDRTRSKLLQMAALAKTHNIPWSFQPDWKILLAALQYEDATTAQTTQGKNFLRYMHEDLGVIIDPHSHEKQGYNYTDRRGPHSTCAVPAFLLLWPHT